MESLKITEKKYIEITVLLCMLVYFVSYLTRINFGTVIAEIVRAEGFTKSDAALVTTMSFLSYGVGQLISGYIGERIKPKYLIFSGLLLTSVCNVLMPVFTALYAMRIIWFVNGFAQAFMWPPLIKFITVNLTKKDYPKACVNISLAASLATIALYLVSPFIIKISDWKAVFVVSAIIGITCAFIWFYVSEKIEEHRQKHGTAVVIEKEEKKKHIKVSLGRLLITTNLLLIAIAIILQGILRDGITTWMPSYISETYHLGTEISILSAVILPLFSMICLKLTAALNEKLIKNDIKCAEVMFLGGFFAALALTFLFSSNSVTAIILSSVITACMHGVNLMLVCMIPSHYEKYGKVSEISGILNFCTYIGSAVSTYGIARLAENMGWQMTIGSWALISVIGFVICKAALLKAK